MDGRSEFFVYMGAALGTTFALFTAQIWYASYLDVSVVHAQQLDAPVDAKLQSVRDAERAKLAGGAVPIAEAMKAIAQRGRGASQELAPQPSDDLSAMSGWAHRKGFKPYEPRIPAAPPPPAEPAPAEGGPPAEGAPAEGAAPTQGAQPAAPAPSAKVATVVARPAPPKAPPAAVPPAPKPAAAPAPSAP